jgi:hypothetical protein
MASRSCALVGPAAAVESSLHFHQTSNRQFAQNAVSFRGGKYGTSGCEFLRSASVEISQQCSTVLFSQSQERKAEEEPGENGGFGH